MSIKQKARDQALNICETILNLIIVVFGCDVECIDCRHWVRSQFVDATIFGYFIVNLLVFIAIFIEEQRWHKIWRGVETVLGAALFLITAILIFDNSRGRDRDRDYGYAYGDRHRGYTAELIIIGILCLCMVVLYIIDAILVFKKNAIQVNI